MQRNYLKQVQWQHKLKMPGTTARQNISSNSIEHQDLHGLAFIGCTGCTLVCRCKSESPKTQQKVSLMRAPRSTCVKKEVLLNQSVIISHNQIIISGRQPGKNLPGAVRTPSLHNGEFVKLRREISDISSILGIKNDREKRLLHVVDRSYLNWEITRVQVSGRWFARR